MCGRFVLASEPGTYADYFEARVDESVAPLPRSYNVAPTDYVYAVRVVEAERVLAPVRWGLVPRWVRDRRTIHINARAETVATRPAFRDSLATRRCLVPAEGFYEWEPPAAGRRPHWVYRADGFPVGFAALWSSWRDPGSGERVETCAIVTTAARGVIASIHDRMPVMLDPSRWAAWLDPATTDPASVLEMLVPIDPDLVMAHPVSPEVNSVHNNHPGLVSKATEEPAQPTLF